MTTVRTAKRAPRPELWPGRAWNQPAGRVLDWLHRWRKSGSDISRGALLWAYQTSVQKIGKAATVQAVQGAGEVLPDWLDRAA